MIPVSIGQKYRSATEIYTAEIQQIIQRRHHTLIFGGRFQAGNFHTRNDPIIDTNFASPFFTADQFVVQNQSIESDLERITGYGYYNLQACDSFLLIAGVSYDRLTAPRNFRYAPVSSGETTTDRISPKAGFIWTPGPGTTVRAAYSQSLSGVSFDQSFQLEPSQIAGFGQAYRSIIPEAISGANAGARFEVAGIALDQKFASGAYLGVSGQFLWSKVKREFGVYDDNSTNVVNTPPYIFPSSTRQRLKYKEPSLTINLNQLIGDEWALGLRYRLSYADLKDEFIDIPAGTPTPPGFSPRRHVNATLHELALYGIYTHPSGVFGQAEGLHFSQENHGYSSPLAGDEFWQVNAFVGYRFPKRYAEVRIGLLNINNRDYRLNPLNLTTELPRTRTFVAGFRFHF